MPAYQDFDAYVKAGGYAVLRACLSGARKVDDVIAALSDGGLRGLGGAGFPTGRKWGLVRAEKGPRLMAVNGDEGEPGTFKDRIYLESEPHKFLEGMLIAAWAVEAEQVFIYMRDEYPAVLKILEAEIPKLEAAGLAKHTKVHVRRGAGAYICGEESAMIESIEGKRGLPRHRPPYVAQVGVFGRPTLVNNIETLYWVPAILEKGAAWFASPGQERRQGPALLLGVGPREEAGRRADRRRLDLQGPDRARAAAWPTAITSRATCRAAPRAASCRPTWPTSPSTSASSRSTAASSAATPW